MSEKKYFEQQLLNSIEYQKFRTKLDKKYSDHKFTSSNERLLEGLYNVKLGACANPKLIQEMIFPSSAKMGKITSFRPITPSINDRQRRAVSMGLAMENLMVLQGPPGTGKTTFILELIRQLKKRNSATRILITSQSHLAVDNVIEGFWKKKEFLDQLARIKTKGAKAPDPGETFEPKFISFEEDLKCYSEYAIFKKIADGADEKLKKILNSFDNDLNERYGNDFLGNNISLILTNKSIVGITCNSMPGCHFENGDPYDYVIVDEVGKFSFAELINVARVARRLILIGDTKQLPAVLPDEDKDQGIKFRDEESFNADAYDYLVANNYIDFLFNNINKECKTALNLQYRMSNAIGTFISKQFYNGEVENGVNREVSEAINFITYNTEVLSATSDDEFEKETSKRENATEVAIISKLLDTMIRIDGIDPKNIAIIVPYRDQVNIITKSIKEIPSERISTIDSYQGKEFDYIIFGCTRTAKPSSFSDDAKRINVAISRAKEKVYVIGHWNMVLKTTNLLALYNDPNCTKWIYFDGEIKKKGSFSFSRTKMNQLNRRCDKVIK